MIRHGKHTYPGLHEPILDLQTFDQVQALLASKANTSTSAAGKDDLHLSVVRTFGADGCLI